MLGFVSTLTPSYPFPFLCVLFLIWLGVSEARAQPDGLANTDTSSLLISKVRFSGDLVFSKEALSLRIRTRANRRFLNIPGFTWWLWIYKLGDSGKLGQRVSNALRASGEAPAYLDSTLIESDVERLTNYYIQEGFPQARIGVEVQPTRRVGQVQVVFTISPGKPTHIRAIEYEGVEGLTTEQQRVLLQGSVLNTEQRDPGNRYRLHAVGERYSEPRLVAERTRILTYLQSQGYAAISRDSIRAIITPFRPDSFDVRLRIRPGPRYRFGDIHYEVNGPEDNVQPRTRTLPSLPPEPNVEGGNIAIEIENDSRIRSRLLTRTLQFRPGEWYNQERVRSTKRRMESTGVFAFTDLVPLVPDTMQAGGELITRLPYRIELQTRERHRLRFETFMLQRNDVFTGSDSELGAGGGVTYENGNLFGAGEVMRLGVQASIAGDIRTRLFTSAQTEVTASLTYPYLVRPFRGLDRRLNLFDARTQLAFTFLAARRDELGLILRGRGGLRFRLEMRHSPTLTSLVDVLDVTVSNPDTLNNFREKFLDQVLEAVQDPVQRAQIQEDYTEPQINNALRYTLRSARVNALRRDQGYSYEGAFEVGGNLPYWLDRFVFSPDTVEGTLPALPIFQGDRESNRLLYRQYVRLAVDLRQYRPLGPSTVFAWKFIGGLAQPIYRSNIVPFDRRFYSGGASSVRGWRLRELGPGALDLRELERAQADSVSSGGSSTNILGGDIKLEGSVELRQGMLRNVLAADWVVALFMDVGNVWFGPRNPGDERGRFEPNSFFKEMGVGSGIGLRIAWEYLIIRFDLAYKVNDPAIANSSKLPLVHFGIGHAF